MVGHPILIGVKSTTQRGVVDAIAIGKITIGKVGNVVSIQITIWIRQSVYGAIVSINTLEESGTEIRIFII